MQCCNLPWAWELIWNCGGACARAYNRLWVWGQLKAPCIAVLQRNQGQYFGGCAPPLLLHPAEHYRPPSGYTREHEEGCGKMGLKYDWLLSGVLYQNFTRGFLLIIRLTDCLLLISLSKYFIIMVTKLKQHLFMRGCNIEHKNAVMKVTAMRIVCVCVCVCVCIRYMYVYEPNLIVKRSSLEHTMKGNIVI